MNANKKLRVFFSFQHKSNQEHYKKLKKVITELKHIDISVNKGNLVEDEDSRSDYEQIREEIRKKHLVNVNVTVVIVGRDSTNRKHIDWEIKSTISKFKNSQSGAIVVINALDDPRAKAPTGRPFTWISDPKLFQLHEKLGKGSIKSFDWPQKISNDEVKWLPLRLANSITERYSYNNSKKGKHRHAIFPIISYKRALDKSVMERALLHAYENIHSNKGKWDLGPMRVKNNCSPKKLKFKQVPA